MKKLLICLLCFVVGVGCVYGVNYYFRMQARQDFVNHVQPSLTPSQTFQYYWQSAAANQIDDVRLFATTIPPSYWVRCEGEAPTSNSTGDNDTRYDKEFAGLTDGIAIYTAFVRASGRDLSRLRVISERVYENEAVVDFEFIITSSYKVLYRAYMFKENNAWRLFDIANADVDSLSFLNVEEYARPRQKCAPPPSGDKFTLGAVETLRPSYKSRVSDR